MVYLTEAECTAISGLSHTLGKGKSELIRCAIDEFINRPIQE
ncbi:MAG: hypothetical protein ACH346_08460 [Chthoniobacterales bacterium]